MGQDVQYSNEKLGFEQAWPLLTVGLSALGLVAITLVFMILKYVILPKRHAHVPTDEA